MNWNELEKFYSGKSVLVTGHTGFKGSWLTRMLMLAGAKVTGYSLNPPTDPSLFEIAGLEDTMDSVIGDVRDLARLQEVFERVQPQVVFHSHFRRVLNLPQPHFKQLCERRRSHRTGRTYLCLAAALRAAYRGVCLNYVAYKPADGQCAHYLLV